MMPDALNFLEGLYPTMTIEQLERTKYLMEEQIKKIDKKIREKSFYGSKPEIK